VDKIELKLLSQKYNRYSTVAVRKH